MSILEIIINFTQTLKQRSMKKRITILKEWIYVVNPQVLITNDVRP